MRLVKSFFGVSFFIVLIVEVGLGLRLQSEIDKLSSRIQSNNENEVLKTILDQQISSEKSELQLLNRQPAGPRAGTSQAKDQTNSSRPENFETRFNTAIQNPVFLELLRNQQKLLLDERYGALFKRLQLTPQQLDQFKNLLVEKQLAKSDDKAVARELGGTPGETALAAQDDVNSQISSLLGDSGYAQYQHYEETNSLRTTVSRLQQTLSYTATPLTDDQAGKLVELWYQAMPPSQKSNATGVNAEIGSGLIDGNSTVIKIPPSGLDLAKTVLLPAQVTAVQHLMTIQQAQAQLMKLASAQSHAK